jgi:hypothetical protein
MVYFSRVIRNMITDNDSSKRSRIVAIAAWVLLEAAFIAFLAWVFFVTLWYLES